MTSRIIFLNFKPNAGYPTGAKPKRKKKKKNKKEKKEKKKKKEQNDKQINKNKINKRRKKDTKRKEKNMSPFCNLYPITAMQFMFGKLFPEIML